MPEAISAHPLLYQINTRVWLTALGRELGRQATLDDVPDAEIERIAARGFDWVWLLSVWRTGDASRAVSRSDPELRREFEATLPDLREEDIAGSGFAISGYVVAPGLGGDAALRRLRQRLAERGLRLMLDFVPNHTGLDHPWIEEHPDYYVAGSELDLLRSPGDYAWVRSGSGDVLLAHGRDPYFPGWSDTLQLDYANPATREAMTRELLAVADRCDGVRCDMAMLVLPDVFARTWGRTADSFWPDAIARVRQQVPGFTFMAEVYWDLEWTMLEAGFDYAYDKRLYDRLRAGAARPVREHLLAGMDYQRRLARFLENHDEPRAAVAFNAESYEGAAIVTYLTPGLRFFHQGQLEGRRARISPHLVRAPDEPPNAACLAFYERLLDVLRRPAARSGEWRLAGLRPAWGGDGTWDQFIAWTWAAADGDLLVAVNYGPATARCFVELPFERRGGVVRFRDLLSGACYDREGDDVAERGLYLEMPGWAYHAFAVERAG